MNEETKPERCELCRFAAVGEVDQHLQRALICRRFPPTPLLFPAPNGAALGASFPATTDAGWCGEFVEGTPERLAGDDG